MTAALDPATAQEVLAQLDDELGGADPDVRAIVAVTRRDNGSVALTDVELRDNAVLEAPKDAGGLVVVTSERLQADDVRRRSDAEDSEDAEVLEVRALVCVLRDGTEVGLARLGDDPTARVWRSDVDPDGSAAALRPRDLASNTARRAFGLASLTTPVPIEQLLSRVWLLAVVQAALDALDPPGAAEEVEVADVVAALRGDPLAPLRAETERADTELARHLDWEQVRQAAARGGLVLGPYALDAEHAAWLDADGFAQYLDQTMLSADELLETLELVGGDALCDWAVAELVDRDWHDR